MAQIEIKNLSFTYPNCKGKALDSVNLEIEAGELCLLIGKSGSGKSTLLRLMKKEAAPCGSTTGSVQIQAQNTAILNQYVESNVITDTVFGELAFLPSNMGYGRKQVLCKIAEAANYFNLTDVIDSKTDALSGGTKQMLSLACVTSGAPGVLLLDEPTSQLDPVSAELFINTVLKLRREAGITVVITEHRPDALLAHADKICLLEGGRLQFCLPPQQAADFLVRQQHEMADVLPPYSMVLPGHPIDFAEAKKSVQTLKYKADRETREKCRAAVTVKHITFTYEKGKDVLSELDFTAFGGKINAIVGANGTGKTTLLKCIASLLNCRGGKIKRGGKTAYLPQNIKALFLEDTVLQEAGGEDVLKEFDLCGFESRSPFDLSVGEQQRLALAKVIKTGADILLLDEPTKSLDVVFRRELGEMLRSLARRGKTVIIALHDLEFAAKYADFVSLLFGGEIICTERAKPFFSSFDMYTTALSRLTNGRAVSAQDIDCAGKAGAQ